MPDSSPYPSPSRSQEARAARQPGRDGRRTLRSEDLLQGQVEVLIEHGVEVYRLRLTRSGKLILQK